MKTLVGLLHLMLISVASAQTGTTIPPNVDSGGPANHSDKDAAKEMQKTEKDVRVFMQKFKAQLKQCPNQEHLKFQKKKTKHLVLGDVYTSLLLLGIEQNKTEKCQTPMESIEKISNDRDVKCIFENPEVQYTALEMTSNTLFNDYITREYPGISEPGQVKIFFEALIAKEKFHGSKK